MPPFNAEFASKAADKRIGALEKKYDDIEKLTRQIDLKALAGIATNVADLTKRVTTLEAVVKALGQASTATRGGGGMIAADALAKAGFMKQDEVTKLMNDAMVKQNAVIVKESKAMQQQIADQAKDASKAAMLESRLKVLEGQVQAALAGAGARRG